MCPSHNSLQSLQQNVLNWLAHLAITINKKTAKLRAICKLLLQLGKYCPVYDFPECLVYIFMYILVGKMVKDIFSFVGFFVFVCWLEVFFIVFFHMLIAPSLSIYTRFQIFHFL